jgi:thiosulfate/3-mercaptopyruvate sulfurtransferase
MYNFVIRTNMRTTLIFLWIILVITGQSAIADHKEHHGVLISPEALNERLDTDNLVIVDARTPKEYAKGHLPGAVNVSVFDTYSKEEPKDRVANIHAIQKLFGSVGVDNKSQIVIYDSGGFIDAARVFWVLEVYGHTDVSVLTVGYNLWEEKGLAVTTEITPPKKKSFYARIRPQKLATKLSTRLAIEDEDTIILDARSGDEYDGLMSKSKRFGHIPSAESAVWLENIEKVNKSSRLKDYSQLKSLYGKYPKDKKIITYCNKGRQSSLTYLLLRELDYDVAHYDGSWHEWGNDDYLPVVNKSKGKK